MAEALEAWLQEGSSWGRWLVVVADHPWAAFRHGQHAVHRGELKCGWCGPCQATSFDIHRSLAAALRVDADPARYP